MATLLIDLEDRYLVVFREPKRDTEMPNRAVVFDVGGIATLMWNHDINFKLYYLTFLKTCYDIPKVYHFLNNYRFKLYNASAVEMGEPSIKGYAYLSNKYIIARTNGKELPDYGKGPMERRVTMSKIEPENADQSELVQWDKYKRPIVKFMFQYIYNKVKLSFPAFPEIELLSPDEKNIVTDTKLKFELKDKKGGGFTLNYIDPNIEGKYEVEQIWNMLWSAIFTALKKMCIDDDYFQNLLKGHMGDKDLNEALRILGFDYDEIKNERFVMTIKDDTIYQKTVNPKKIETYISK